MPTLYLKLKHILITKEPKICKKVVEGENVSHGIRMNGRNQKKSPSIATHLKQNMSSDIESPSSPVYSFAMSAILIAWIVRNTATA